MKLLPSLLCAVLFLDGWDAHAQADPPAPPKPLHQNGTGTMRAKPPTRTAVPTTRGGPTATISSKPPTAREREAMLRVQIFLDGEFFSPGKLDGLPGEFTEKAISRFQKARGLDETGNPHNLPISPDLDPYAWYTLRPEDRKYVGGMPSKPEEQARSRYLPYGSYREFLSERFHCAESLLDYLNPGMNLDRISIGETVKVPAVEPFEIESLKSLGALPESPEFQGRKIRINRKDRMLELVEHEQLLASVPITPGSPTLPTPAGKWKLLAIATMPVFRWDEGVLNRGVRTANFFMLPPGPNNPVGVAWCALNKPGIGIHGTNSPETIGRARSHGCMRVANWDIARLIRQITPGITVLIE